ncbi:hypothetical protein evm_015399 [Chilo suppressalis]|nr:hypothetical protein evm_015399 [Chilo suppressalis]
MTLRCINCDIRVSRMRRYLLTHESESLRDVIKLWTYPRELTNTDYICQACWELGTAQVSGANNVPVQERQVGHINVCVGCGRSILRRDSRIIVRENASNEENQIVNVISRWIIPRQLTPTDQACMPCWLRARRVLTRHQIVDDNRDDETIKTCINCNEELPHGSGHILEGEEDSLFNIIKHWTYPSHINSMDYICHACWQLANEATRQIDESPDSTPQPLQVEDSSNTEPQQADDPQDPTTDPPEANDFEDRNIILLPSVRRAAATTRHCVFPDCLNAERYHVPDRVRSRVVQETNYYIPRSARVCSFHTTNYMYHNLYSSSNSYNTFNSGQIEDLVFILTDELNVRFDFEDVTTIPEHLLHYWIGITKDQHHQILCESQLINLRRGGFALTALLCKLRTGDSGDRLSALFQIPRRTIETLMDIAREYLMLHFVPRHLGLQHMSRDEVVSKNSIIANGIFGNSESLLEERQAIVICDGTYIYTQKSTNYFFQKSTYSTHKYRNLVKPFMIVCCDGHILDVLGPFPATTNDATIMSSWIEQPDVLNFFKEDDIFILDRGFRDCLEKIHNCGFEAHMPETLSPGHSQLTTLEGNRSRCVTINRWVVEAVNGKIKRDFKIFRQEYFNRAGPHLIKDFKIAAALLNKFSTPFTDSIHANEIVSIIHERIFLSNVLAGIVATHNLNRRNAYFNDITTVDIAFPQLNMDDLILFACGTYQIRQARSYIGEHIRFHGVYETQICRENVVDLSPLDGEAPMLIRARIKSRHISRKIYNVFIALDRTQVGIRAIIGYCCNCIVGLRTIGCCSHIMSIMWYLGYARYLDNLSPPAEILDGILIRLEE